MICDRQHASVERFDLEVNSSFTAIRNVLPLSDNLSHANRRFPPLITSCADQAIKSRSDVAECGLLT